MSGIYPAMLAVMREVSAVGKKDRNQAQNFNFRGVDAVVNALGPALRKHGVFVVPEITSVDHQTVETKGKSAAQIVVQIRYTFYAEDGSSVSASVPGEAMDYGDKGLAKAMSVAFRICLLQAFALPTDEPDPDSQAFERAGSQRVSDRKPAAVSEADAARDELRKVLTAKAIPLQGAVNEFQKRTGESLKDSQDAAAIRALIETYRGDAA